ncbi:hypothetical protein ACLK1S_15000 [Escherichia coli]
MQLFNRSGFQRFQRAEICRQTCCGGLADFTDAKCIEEASKGSFSAFSSALTTFVPILAPSAPVRVSLPAVSLNKYTRSIDISFQPADR